jgi:IS30 family transposase
LRYIGKAKQVILRNALKKRLAGLLINQKWNHELIADRLPKQTESFVDHKTIYKWIWTAKNSNHSYHTEYRSLYKHLPHTDRRQKRYNVGDNRGAITAAVSI